MGDRLELNILEELIRDLRQAAETGGTHAERETERLSSDIQNYCSTEWESTEDVRHLSIFPVSSFQRNIGSIP